MITSKLVLHLGMVKVILARERKTTYLNTGIHVDPENWDRESCTVTGRKDAARITAYVTQFLDDVQDHIFRLTREERFLELSRVRDLIGERVDGRKAKVAQRGNLAPFWASFEKSRVGAGTKATYEQTRKNLERYCDMQSLSFEDISVKWLREYEQHLRDQGLAVNSVSIHLRNIRAVFNAAIDEDVTTSYPFRKYRIRTEQTRKRAVSVETLRQIASFPADDDQRRYRDLFMLMFYLIGINIVDMLHLDGIHDGRVEYRRAKTGRLYSVRVEPEALEIIERYRGRKYLLDILDRWSDEGRGFNSKMNHELKRLGPYELSGRNHMKKECRPIAPELSTYWARHTWATIAASLDIPKETIAAALGHGGHTVTDIYINFDQRKVDEANRKVIDYVLKRGVYEESIDFTGGTADD